MTGPLLPPGTLLRTGQPFDESTFFGLILALLPWRLTWLYLLTRAKLHKQEVQHRSTHMDIQS